jgi:hypothetical protein
VQSANEDHEEQEGGYDDLAPRHIQNHPLKTRPKFHNRLGVTLDVVKKGHESCERISDRVRTTVAIEHVNHLEAFAMKTGSSVVKKKVEPPILESNLKLTLPITTGFSVGRVSDEKGIRTMGGVILRPKVVINFILHVQITLDILDLRKLEGFRRTKRRLGERSERRGGGRRTGHRRRGREDGSRRNRTGQRRPSGQSDVRTQSGGEIATGQRAQRRNCRSSGRRHRCRNVGMPPRRRRDLTMKDDRGNRLRDRPWKVVGMKSVVI